jgi:glycosyltransferase involved in cell wall biosynthesis
VLNLFYAEPDGDRWLPLDRFPRRLLRRIIRGKRRPGGQERVFLNLMAGLDRLQVPYRVNDYRYARRHPDELCCILGKRHVLEQEPWRNPLMVGPCVHDHPIDDPALFDRFQVRRILVPGPWMRDMCRPAWGDAVHAWPVGIDTEHWRPEPAVAKTIDVILYNKIRWDHARRETELLTPIRTELARRSLKVLELRYGHYQPADYEAALHAAHCMVFVCEHETQGIAYQEALATGVPLVAWDHAGEWLDPSYHPHRIRYGPISSVPYWDDRCGTKFATAAEFPAALDALLARQKMKALAPRQYVLDHLALADCARTFVDHARCAAEGRNKVAAHRP